MVINRGEIWWADLPEPTGSSPGYRRPVVIIQSDIFNKTNLNTSIVALITTNPELAKMRGNVLLKKHQSELPKDSIVNVTQVFTLDKSLLLEYVGGLTRLRTLNICKKGFSFFLVTACKNKTNFLKSVLFFVFFFSFCNSSFCYCHCCFLGCYIIFYRKIKYF